MLLIEYNWLVPDTTDYVTVRAFVPIQVPEHNPDHVTQVKTALREFIGRTGCGAATWIAGEHAGQVVFNGNGADLF